MKSGGPWNLKGLRPEARETARTAARRSGMSVGEWLNDVIEPDDEEIGDEPALFTDFYDEPEEEDAPPAARRRADRERRRDRPDSHRELREERKRGVRLHSANKKAPRFNQQTYN